jgi:hypothetical protein
MKLDVPQKIIGDISMELVDNLLHAIEEDDWHEEDYRRDAGSMNHCNSIPIHHTELCYSALETKEPIRMIRECKLYDKFIPYINPILDELRKHYNFNQYACFLARLNPNQRVDAHIDRGTFLSMCHRVHVPLKSNAKVKYIIENNTYYWEPGKIYEFDNMRLHGVVNTSEEDRIHLVVNLYNLPEDF